MFLVKMCENCVKSSNDEWNAGYVNGFFEAFSPGDNICPYCNSILINTNLSYEDFRIIRKVSSDVTFIEAMTKLHQDDIIEYESRMCHFRSQIQQKEQAEKIELEQSNPHCPHCNSTNIKSLSSINRGVSIAMWGIFSKKINKSFECLDCKYTW